jgi:hypothetical protein
MYSILLEQYSNRYDHTLPYSCEKYHKKKIESLPANFNLEIIIGHIYYDYTLIKNWGYKNILFATMLRDPIKRLLSMYYYVHYNVPAFIAHEERIQCLSFRDWCKKHDHFLLRDNYLIRYLIAKPEGSINRNDYQEAKLRLEEDYNVVGITERFNESLYLMYQKLNWLELPLYANKVNVTSLPKDFEQVRECDLNEVRAFNQYDIELYNYFKKRFECSLTDLSYEYRRELSAFLSAQKDLETGKHSIDLAKFWLRLGYYSHPTNDKANIYIFGTGRGGQLLYKALPDSIKDKVKGFLDNLSSFEGNELYQKAIFKPSKAEIGAYDYVIIGSLSYADEMQLQLYDMGVSREQIVYPHKLLCKLLHDNLNTQTFEKEQLVIQTATESVQAVISYYETTLRKAIKQFPQNINPLMIKIYADKEIDEFVSQAIERITDCKFEFIGNSKIAADLYIIAVKSDKWSKCVDKVLDMGIEADRIVFLD